MRRQRLIDARKVAGKSQEKVAEEVGVDRTSVSGWERGDFTPQPRQRSAYAAALGVTLSELDSMLTSMPPADGEVPDWLSRYLAEEQSASEIRVYEPEVVYGLLQTPAYTEAIVRRVGLNGVTEDYVRQNIEQRRARQRRVLDGAVRLHVVHHETVLHVRLGDAAVMAEQLHAMADLAERDNVTVQITTFDAGQFEARRIDTFDILVHPWGSPTVCLEGYGGTRFIGEADEVAYFVAVFNQAADVALAPDDSVAYIREMAQRWETRR